MPRWPADLRFLEQVERVKLYPESGAILFDSFRRVVLQRFPFMVVYLVGEERIDLLAVLNARHVKRESGTP